MKNRHKRNIRMNENPLVDGRIVCEGKTMTRFDNTSLQDAYAEISGLMEKMNMHKHITSLRKHVPKLKIEKW